MEWIKKILLSDFLGSFLRHALTTLSGFLLAKGIITAEQASGLVEILVSLIPAILSYLLGQGFALVKAKQTSNLKSELGIKH